MTAPTDCNTLLSSALAAVRRGFAVIPLTRTKLPAIRSPHRDEPRTSCRGACGRIGHGIHDATTDPEAVHALFAAAPWATGYGIACGRAPHHLVGIDLDVKNDVDGISHLEHLANGHGFDVPDTITVATPSGGRHLWLRGPADVAVPNSVGRLAPGIDVRGSGGYLVGPGSVTLRGRYGLMPGTGHHELQPVPEPLLQLLAPAIPRTIPVPSLAMAGIRALSLVQFVLDAPEGQRNDRLYWAACRAHETTDGPLLAAALIDAALHTGLPETEARATVASAARRMGAGR
ncbi:bifunctional DNA primase/polymerase [Streptomyces sp. NPDC059544]|uniref:bifunctional DNA primase/polymerase n=1 Tax=Streptomyces sp. NPDC059544 TaxID=3346861 RepID=UPI0036C02E5F